jgi:hypothetical protein
MRVSHVLIFVEALALAGCADAPVHWEGASMIVLYPAATAEISVALNCFVVSNPTDALAFVPLHTMSLETRARAPASGPDQISNTLIVRKCGTF